MKNYYEKWIKLEWFGPIPHIDFKNEKIINDYPKLVNKGLYLICLFNPFSKEYLITYIGSAEKGNTCIYNRVNYWFNAKNCTFLKISKDNNEIVVDIANENIYDDEIDENLRKDNIEKSFIFFAIPRPEDLNMIKEQRGIVYQIRQIEGGLRHLIRRKMESRKYDITTENAGWRVKPYEIKNIIVKEGIRILGFS